MSSTEDFTSFLAAFFKLFTQKVFRRVDYLTYLSQPGGKRTSDEAPVVDTAIVGPLLGLLGFEPGERVYNQQRQHDRPDFAPIEPVYGTCFMVEDKNTSLDLNFNLANPDSHLSQLAGYVRSGGVRLGWLTNGRQFTVWSFEDPSNPTRIIDLDIPTAVLEWKNSNQLSPIIEKQLHDLFDLCRKEAFADMNRLEQEIGISLEKWQRRALPLGTGDGYEATLVEEMQSLVMELQRNARRILDGHLGRYTEKVFEWHQRQAILSHDYQADRRVYDDYFTWTSLVKETMLGGMDEERQRDEFALQAAYVVFIRLLLIRVCEDKGIFKNRFISDGGLEHWQEDIKRYFVFALGNPYDPLLDIAYANAQNIYAHFFTGRELFNWYRLDRPHFVMALHRLSRFDFAGVDSDIIGTIYNTYVDRKEKREKGQYYTPPTIVNYILDNIGYTGTTLIGPNKRLIDPACGSGTFLVSAARRFVAAYAHLHDPITVLAHLQQSIFGFDLNPFACYLAEVNLLIQVLDLVKQAYDAGQHPKIERFHIYNVDALSRPTGRYYYTHFNTLLAEENDQVDQIKRRAPNTPYGNGFAFVVANPPYGATLSETYKDMLRSAWADVFYGQPDTYTFFLKFGLELLAPNGKLGFITPNTYLMGTHTAVLRHMLLTKGRIEQIVDLPQGIWPDVNVDCVLLFLTAEADEVNRKAQQVQINVLALRDTLEKLTERMWVETLTQSQARWLANAKYEINIRYDALLQQIEQVCIVSVNGGSTTKIQRLGDVTESTQGIIPYHTRAEGKTNPYIKPRREVPPDEPDWKPLLDGSAFIGRYELRWGRQQPYLKYGSWLYSVPKSQFFESPKLLIQDMRNRALKRRLVATFDDQKFYNRHNFDNIIAKDPDYDLKYILALVNSSVLNYWFARQFDNVHINPSYFRQLPIYPAA